MRSPAAARLGLRLLSLLRGAQRLPPERLPKSRRRLGGRSRPGLPILKVAMGMAKGLVQLLEEVLERLRKRPSPPRNLLYDIS